MNQQPPVGGDAGRGLLLIAGAVLIGVLLLAKGFSDPEVDTASADQADLTTESTVDTVPSSTVAELLDPSQVTLVVANGTGTPGLAGEYNQQLVDLGYATSDPTDATNAPNVEATNVFFTEEFQSYQAEAEGVATALGLPASVVAPMPADPPVTLGPEIVVVVLGNDIDTLIGGGGGTTGSTVPGASTTVATTIPGT